MKKIPLLPRYFRRFGILLVLISLMFYINGILKFLPFSTTDNYIKTYNLINTSRIQGEEDFRFGLHDINLGFFLIVLPSLLGLGFIAFSKLKIVEDELISSLRLFAWSWSVLLFFFYNFFVIIFTGQTVYLSFAIVSPHFLFVMFILIFHFQLIKMNRRLANEE